MSDLPLNCTPTTPIREEEASDKLSTTEPKLDHGEPPEQSGASNDVNESENQEEENTPPEARPDFGIDNQHFKDLEFETFVLAKEALEKWAKDFGFAVKGKNQYKLQKTGGRSQDFLCARSGVYVKSASASQAPQYKVATNLTDCKWKSQIKQQVYSQAGPH
ncbi:hypothetical protein DFS34DRAFT_590910 [Phlyctochytrium arcticum]|nr:hypothetical protein DFS34DRAFT_590910 [Phlyctochytrium arcticum]